MGIADLGQAPGGPYSYTTDSFIGAVDIGSLRTITEGEPPNTMSFQLNVYLEFNGTGGEQVYWVQDVVGLGTNGSFVSLPYLESSVLNVTGENPGFDTEAISGNGTLLFWRNEPLFTYSPWCTQAASQLCQQILDPHNGTLPVSFQLRMNATETPAGQPMVTFEYDGGYGWINFNSVTFTTETLNSPPAFIVSGYNIPAFDAELVAGGPSNGENVSDVLSEVGMQLSFWNGHNYQAVTNAANFGIRTAEGISNAVSTEVFQPGGEPEARLTAGNGTRGWLYNDTEVSTLSVKSPLSEGVVELQAGSSSAPPYTVPFVGGDATLVIQPGTYYLSVYNGTAIYSKSELALTAGQTLQLQAPFVAVTCSPSPGVLGSPSECTATVSGNSPTGSVEWATSGSGKFSSAACSVSSGECSVAYTPSSAPPVTILAVYQGDADNPGGSGAAVLAATRSSSSTAVSCSTESQVGGEFRCAATVTGFAPTGVVSFTQSGTGSFAPSTTSCALASASCSVNLTGAAVGTIVIIGTYQGDENNVGSTSQPSNVTVLRGATSLSLSCTPPSIPGNGTTTTCTAVVTGGTGPGGMNGDPVDFSLSGVGPAVLNSSFCTLFSGSCSVTLLGSGGGVAILTASYAGSQENMPSSGEFAVALTTVLSPAGIIGASNYSLVASIALCAALAFADYQKGTAFLGKRRGSRLIKWFFPLLAFLPIATEYAGLASQGTLTTVGNLVTTLTSVRGVLWVVWLPIFFYAGVASSPARAKLGWVLKAWLRTLVLALLFSVPLFIGLAELPGLHFPIGLTEAFIVLLTAALSAFSSLVLVSSVHAAAIELGLVGGTFVTGAVIRMLAGRRRYPAPAQREGREEQMTPGGSRFNQTFLQSRPYAPG